MQYDQIETHKIDIVFGKPKSGKTLFAGSYPKPLLYISVGNDGGGSVLVTAYRDDYEKGLIKVKNITNDRIVNGNINQTSIEKLGEILAELRKPTEDKFKTIVIDTVSALQDDQKAFMEFKKHGTAMSQQEWGDVSRMMLSIKDTMKRFSQDIDTRFVWIFHTSEQELYETSGLNKEIRIIPDVTIKTGIKYMKEAQNIFYMCRKTILRDDGTKSVKFLTYVGPHPLMDTGTREMLLKEGDFVEDLTFSKWQAMTKARRLESVDVFVGDSTNDSDNNKEENEND